MFDVRGMDLDQQYGEVTPPSDSAASYELGGLDEIARRSALPEPPALNQRQVYSFGLSEAVQVLGGARA